MVNTLNEILLKKNVTKTDSEFMKKNIYNNGDFFDQNSIMQYYDLI